MRKHLMSLAAVASLSLTGGAAAQAFGPAGSPVDRNVEDTGPNSASQRVIQRGIGQFGRGSLLIDRFDNRPQQLAPFNPLAGDLRTSQRYLLQAPGVTALLNRPDYIGPSPNGGIAFNQQTIDGREALGYSANTVFVLSPELLAPPRSQDEIDASWLLNPHRVKPTVAGDPHALMRESIVTGQPTNYIIENHPAVQQNPNYVHPEIIERRKRWKAEREAEEAAAAEDAAKQAEQDKPQSHEEHEDKASE